MPELRDSLTISATLAAMMALGAAPALAQAVSHDELVEQGRAIYQQGVGGIPCAACHGEDPENRIMDNFTGKNIVEVHAALLDVEVMEGLRLTPEQMAAVTAYAATLDTAVASTTAQPSDLAEQGKVLFESGPNGVGCVGCHGDDPVDLVAPVLGDVDAEAIHAQLANLENMRVRDLTPEEEAALAAYLAWLANR